MVRGELNDGMFLKGKYIKPGLAFDLFTVQNDSLGPDGAPVAGFTNFGLAWYQSDLEARSNGSMKMELRTILLDQIFGFDPAVTLAPTGTFEVGFWFNDPNDAAACGFDVTAPTPFNGEHKAGPLAMITLPDATTGLGPLCTKPDTSVTPGALRPLSAPGSADKRRARRPRGRRALFRFRRRFARRTPAGSAPRIPTETRWGCGAT